MHAFGLFSSALRVDSPFRVSKKPQKLSDSDPLSRPAHTGSANPYMEPVGPNAV